MNKRFFLLGGFTLITLFLGGTLMAGNKTKLSLEYKFKEGQKLTYHISVKGEVSVETPQGPQLTPINVEMEVLQTVLGIDKQTANISMLVKSARTFNGNESATLPEEGQRTLLTIDPLGKIAYSSGIGAGAGSEFAQMVFPNHPLSIGDSWVQNTNTQSGPQLTTKTKYTFSKMETLNSYNCAVFDTEQILEADPSNPAKPAAKSIGKIYFCPNLGQIIQAIGSSQFVFSMPIPMSDQGSVTTRTNLRSEMKLFSGRK